MRRLMGIGLAAAVAGLALLPACGAPPPPVTLRIGVFPVQDFLPYFVMEAQGFARQNGLRFEEVPVAAGLAAVEAMAAGTLDVSPAVGTVPALMAAERGLVPGQVVVVAANNFSDPDHPGQGLLARAGVQGWKDLGGQQIAVPALKSISSAALAGRLAQERVEGWTPVEIPFANMGLAVAGGTVAAAVMSEPYLTQSLLRGDGRLLGWTVGGPPLERMQFTMIAAGADLHRNKPHAIRALLRAHLQAVRWMRANPDGARRILARRLELALEVGQRIHVLRWPADARNDPALLDAMQPLLMQVGMLKAPIPARRLYDERLLDEVLAERR